MTVIISVLSHVCITSHPRGKNPEGKTFPFPSPGLPGDFRDTCKEEFICLHPVTLNTFNSDPALEDETGLKKNIHFYGDHEVNVSYKVTDECRNGLGFLPQHTVYTNSRDVPRAGRTRLKGFDFSKDRPCLKVHLVLSS